MGRVRGVMLGGVAVGLLLVGPSAASAVTIGSAVPPAGAEVDKCTPGGYFAQKASTSPSYAVPASGGAITSWSTDSTGDLAASSLSLLVLHEQGGGYKLDALDTETLPETIPGMLTFTPSKPIFAPAGDVLGIASNSSSDNCYFIKGAVPPTSQVILGAAPTLVVGETYNVVTSGEALLDVAAELSTREDVGVSGAAMPGAVVTGSGAAFVFNVANTGPTAGSVTFTDAVPAGLGVLAAVADAGGCTVAGQLVKCTVDPTPGGTAQVAIVVSTGAVGTFADTATVVSALEDPNQANNVATASLIVSAPACKIVRLAGMTVPTAKAVIPALGCRVGKIVKKASKSVHKGLVISTSPGAGASVPAGTAVKLVVSSGPPAKKHGKHRKK